jgi:hypothetical protein
MVDGGDRSVAGPELFAAGRRARWRHVSPTLGSRPRLPARFGEDWRGCQRLYEAVARVSGARVIVDSSKSPVYARMLSLLPALDLYVVHLVRDARAVVHSWSRPKASSNIIGRPFMTPRPSLRVAEWWVINNLATELLCRRAPGRYLRLRYEDLVDRPRESIESILGWLGESTLELPFSSERTVRLSETHSVKGNPDRFRTGLVDLRLDDDWRRAMSASRRGLVTGLTWPLLRRYGYLGRPRGRGRLPDESAGGQGLGQ